jgi:hypothetical protein
MSEPPSCRVCDIVAASRTIPVLLPGNGFENWPICEACWRLLEVGWRRTAPDGALESPLDGSGVRLTEPQLRILIDVASQADFDIPVIPAARREPERQPLVGDELRQIGGDLQDALAASARGDRAGTLAAVRMIQGRAVIARRALEGMPGPNPAADLPPLVRAVQAVRGLISDREVESLAPDELRARMHVVLQALDRELQAFLQPPAQAPFPADRGRDAPADSCSGLGPE